MKEKKSKGSGTSEILKKVQSQTTVQILFLEGIGYDAIDGMCMR